MDNAYTKIKRDQKESILNKKEKKLNLLLSLSMSVSLIPVMPVLAEEDAAPAAPTADIFPVPQSIVTDSAEGMSLTGPVDVVVHGTRNEAAVTKTGELLDAQGITWSEKTEAEAAESENAKVILAVDCGEDCQTCTYTPDAEGALDHQQGYVLQTSDDENTKGEVRIVGTDKDGVYYGVMTLRQLFQQAEGGRIAEVTVSDYPDVLYRGYVEGFYGTPWTFQDRTSLFEDTSLYKMNTYVYAPKDDPYHRSSWRELYPEDKAEEIRQLVKTADDNNMIFCWTIHPGGDYNYTADSDGDGVVDDFAKLLTKVDQVYDLGVRQFGIFYDDLDYGVANGSRHAETLNAVYEHLKEKDPDIHPMVTVLTRYTNSWGASISGYFKPFMQAIHPDTLVLWTGNSTMSAITKNYYEWPKSQGGVDRDFGSWWNYPVTDYYGGHLLMGQLDCVDNDVDNLASFYMNPMSEADASKVTIFSGADYSWNTADFDAHSSWVRSIQELVPECWEEFCRFADNLAYNDQGSGFLFKESQYLEADLNAFNDALAGNGDLNAAIATLKADFTQIRDDCTALRAVKNEGLLEEITPYVDAYEQLGIAGIGGMEALEAAAKGDIDATMKGRSDLINKTEIVKNKTQKVGSHLLVPFLESLQDTVNTVLAESMDLSQNCMQIVGDNKTMLDEDENGWTSTSGIQAGESIKLRLRRPGNFSVAVNADSMDGLKVETSLNGLDWTELAMSKSGDVYKSGAIVTATWVRVSASADSAGASSVSIVKPVPFVNRSASTNMKTYEANYIQYAFDGDLDTCFWSAEESRSGHVLSLNLGGLYSLSSVEIVSGTNRLGTVDAFQKGVVEVSMDGTNWTAAGEPFNYSEFETRGDDTVHAYHTVTFDPVEARYMRIRETEKGSYWLKIYEIAPTMELIESTACKIESTMDVVEGSDLNNIVDNSLSTYAELSNNGAIADGDSVTLDLQNLAALYDVTITFEEGAAFENTVLETSTDGITWTDRGTLGSDDYTVSDGHVVVRHNAQGALTRYIRIASGSEMTGSVKMDEITWNTISGEGMSLSASTDMGTYQSNAISNAVDGDETTRYYSNAVSKKGNYIQINLGGLIPVYDTSITYGGDPHVAGAVDGFSSTILQYSTDGTTWMDLSEAVPSSEYRIVNGRYICSFTTEGPSARYLRFTAGSDSDSWCQVYEVKVNQALDTNNLRYTSGTATILNSNYLDDGDLNTYPTFYQLSEGQTLVYPMTSTTDVKKLTILQHESSSANTVVEAEKLDGSWITLGALENSYNTFDVNDSIRSICLTFDGTVQPMIYEIIATAMDDEPIEVPEANKTLLRQAISYAEAQVEAGALDHLNTTVLNYFNTALEEARAVEADKKATTDEVNAAWLKLVQAIQMLDFKADKDALAALVEQAQVVLETPLTPESKAALEEAIEKAQAVLDSDTALQESIDKALADLQAALDAAVKVEYSTELLQMIIDAAEEADLDAFINANGEVDAFKAALKEAKNVVKNPESQEQINDTAASLNRLWLSLRLKPDESVLAELRDFSAQVRMLKAANFQPATFNMLVALADDVDEALNNPSLSKAESLDLLDKVNEVKDLLDHPDGDQKNEPAKPDAKDPVSEKPAVDETEKPAESVKPAADTTKKSVKTAASTSLGWSAAAALLSLGGLLSLKRRKRK